LDRYHVSKNIEETLELLSLSPIEWFEENFIVQEEINLENSIKFEQPEYLIKKYSSASLVLEIESSKENFMVLSNAHNKGWRLKVNGEKKPIFMVNGFFQGIKILPGTNEYRLYYLPINIELYSVLSLIGILGIFITYYLFIRRSVSLPLRIGPSI
jgi:uncharacterized membrane protein YfhO